MRPSVVSALCLLLAAAASPPPPSAPPLPAALYLAVPPGNGTAGSALLRAPIVHLVDEAGAQILVHDDVYAVDARYPVVAYTARLTGQASPGATMREPGEALAVVRHASVPLVNGTANFSRMVITYADELRLTFRLLGGARQRADGSFDRVVEHVLPLTSPRFTVGPGAPVALVVLHEPAGGQACSPLALQPRLAIKDAYNNTVAGDAAGAAAGATAHVTAHVIAPPSVRLDGAAAPTAPLDGGVARFGGLRLNGTALGIVLRFESNDSNALSASSASFNCHGEPARLELLPGAPLAVHAVDADGLRTTSITGAPLLAFLRRDDGSETATAPAFDSVGGVWRYTHDEDPLARATAAGVGALRLVANLSAWLVAGGSPGVDGTQPPAFANVSCCALTLPRPSQPGETLASLYVPPLSIARLFARNTGRQGGYGLGDSIEITFNIRTDRAGFAIGERLSRRDIDAMMYFSHGLGPDERAFAAVWRTDCTLLLVAGNTTAAEQPPAVGADYGKGLFTVRLRDDIHELRDAAHALKFGSVVTSPPLEGTFGAAQGLHGRTDPLRTVLPQAALRRYYYDPHGTPGGFVPEYEGQLRGFEAAAGWVERSRDSECDGDARQERASPLDTSDYVRLARGPPDLSIESMHRFVGATHCASAAGCRDKALRTAGK